MGDKPRLVPAIGSVSGQVALILRAEALVVLVCAVAAYRATDASWLLFAILFLVPDLTMAGYAFDNRIGAALYNAGHAYVSPAALALIGWGTTQPLLYSLALIWIAHIGFDRVLGYGLKYRSAFGDTHFGRLNRNPPKAAQGEGPSGRA